MSSTYSLLGDEHVAQDAGALRALDNLALIVLDFTPDSDPADWVVDGAAALIKHLREQAPKGTFEKTRQLVVAAFPSATTAEQKAQRSATLQSLRGIVQSVTREFAHHLQPLNLVAVNRESLGDLASSLEYLDAPDGGYVAGFTFDLETEKAA